jgi:bacterial/archaeal transporter family protein
MQSNIYFVLLLVILSAIFYAAPIIWIKDMNPIASCISSFIALVILVIYAFYIKNHSVSDINNDILIKMIISGISYGLGFLCYIEAIKYNNPTMLNLQTILMFIISTIIGIMILEEEMNVCKVSGIVIIIIGTAFLIYGSHNH